MHQEDSNVRSDIQALARQAQELGTRCVSSALGWLEDRTRHMKNRDQDQTYSRAQQSQSERGSGHGGRHGYGDEDFGTERSGGQRWGRSGEYGAEDRSQYGQNRPGGYRGSEYRGYGQEAGDPGRQREYGAQSGQQYGYDPSQATQGQAGFQGMGGQGQQFGWQGQENQYRGAQRQYGSQQYGQGSQSNYYAQEGSGGGRYGAQYGQQDDYRQYGAYGGGGGGARTGEQFGAGGREYGGRDYGTGYQGQSDYGSSGGRYGSSGGSRYSAELGQPQHGQSQYARLAGQQSMRGRGPKNYSRSDERITEDLNEKLSQDDYIDASEISVEVKQGVATLSGTVEQRWMKHHAEDLAESCSGIKDVENHIRVSTSGSSQRSVSEMGSGSERTPTTASGSGSSWGTGGSGTSTSRGSDRH